MIHARLPLFRVALCILIVLILVACAKERKLQHFKGASPFNGFQNVTYSPDGQTIITANAQTIGIWSADSAALLGEIDYKHGNQGIDLFVTPDGRFILTADREDGTLRFYDPVTKAVDSIFDLKLYNVSYSHDGSHLIGAISPAAVFIIDGAEMSSFGADRYGVSLVLQGPPDAEHTVNDQTTHGDLSRALSAQGGVIQDQTPRYEIRVMGTYVSIETCSYQEVNAPGALVQNIQRQYERITVALSDLETGEGLGETEFRARDPDPCPETFSGTPADWVSRFFPVSDLADWVADQLTGLPNLSGGQGTIVDFPNDSPFPATSNIRAVLSPDERLVSIRTGLALYLRDLGSPEDSIQEQEGIVTIQFSPDDRTALYHYQDGRVIFRDLESGAEIANLSGLPDGTGFYTYSPNGRVFATGSRDGTVRLYDPATGRELLTISVDTAPSAIVFSPDSARMVVANPNGAYIYDVADITGATA